MAARLPGSAWFLVDTEIALGVCGRHTVAEGSAPVIDSQVCVTFETEAAAINAARALAQRLAVESDGMMFIGEGSPHFDGGVECRVNGFIMLTHKVKVFFDGGRLPASLIQALDQDRSPMGWPCERRFPIPPLQCKVVSPPPCA